MPKKKILGKQKNSLKNLKSHDSTDESFKDAKLIKEILVEALMNDDLETFRDVLVAHLRAASKSKLSKDTKLGRQTLYDLIDDEKEFNPQLSTLSSILKNLAA